MLSQEDIDDAKKPDWFISVIFALALIIIFWGFLIIVNVI